MSLDDQANLLLYLLKRSTLCALLLSVFLRPCLGQTETLLEDFEFASSDEAAGAGVIDITDAPNTPAFYISGAAENASPQEPGGLFSIGTSAAFCLNFQFPCDPGTFIGFRLPVDGARFPAQCSTGENYMPLSATYGDPAHPGTTAPDYNLSELSVIWDVYGDGGFADGLTGSHLWLRLIDCEGEAFEFVNLSEVSLYSEIWTLDVVQGDDIVRIMPESLVNVPDGDRLLTEIAAMEVLIQDTDDPPTTIGNWYVDYLRITEPGSGAPGDWDGDGDVDLQDYAEFAGCLVGPSLAPSAPCNVFDFDADSDIDAADYGAFQSALGSQP
jgi:hypothetical protein